jgi:hypothetical protein
MLILLKKYWPSIVAAVGALWGVFGTQIQAVIAQHPTWTWVGSMIAVIVAHLLPSPVANSTKDGVFLAK